MANKLLKFGGTALSDGTAGEAEDWTDTLNESRRDWEVIYGTTNDTLALIPHGSGALSFIQGSEGIYNTADYQTPAITWTLKNSNIILNVGVMAVHCRADKDKAIALEMDNSADASFTSDSGATWGDSGTNPPNQSAIYDAVYATTGVALACGSASSGTHIWRSTDGGDTWAQVSDDGTASTVVAIDMFSATVGFAVDSSGNILTTSDGGDNWTDTGRTSSLTGQETTIMALSATEYLIAGSSIQIYKGTTSSDPTLKFIMGGGYSVMTHFIKTANGNIYIAGMVAGTTKSQGYLMRSTDSGATWGAKEIRLLKNTTPVSLHTAVGKCSLAEADDNVLVLCAETADTVTTIYEFQA